MTRAKPRGRTKGTFTMALAPSTDDVTSLLDDVLDAEPDAARDAQEDGYSRYGGW